MDEYIEREAAYKTIMSEPPDAHYPKWYADKILAIPAADVAYVRHGRCKKSDGKDEWYTYYYTCVECGANMMVADSDYHDVSPNYCPNCGAKMAGGND